MTFELWDLISKNLVDFFDDRQEAINAVQAYVDAGEAAEVVLLEYDDAADGSGRSLTGPELIGWLDQARGELRPSA
jgi:hypothetical protein